MFQFSHPKSKLLSQGVITACSKELEWMLPWWWYHFSSYSNVPVLFVNLGMSDKGLNWCHERGFVLDLPNLGEYVNEVDPGLAQKWRSLVGGNLFDVRRKWFQKPFCFISTPFYQNLWIDIDCQIVKSLEPLWQFMCDEQKIYIRLERDVTHEAYLAHALRKENQRLYNSGVVGFFHGNSLIEDWVDRAYYHNELYLGDQDALSASLYGQENSVCLLESKHNLFFDEENKDPHIIHWVGGRGKIKIYEEVKNSPSFSFYDLKELWEEPPGV